MHKLIAYRVLWKAPSITQPSHTLKLNIVNSSLPHWRKIWRGDIDGKNNFVCSHCSSRLLHNIFTVHIFGRYEHIKKKIIQSCKSTFKLVPQKYTKYETLYSIALQFCDLQELFMRLSQVETVLSTYEWNKDGMHSSKWDDPWTKM